MGNPNVPCGGIPLLLCGDNHQKPPPGDVQWYVELVQGLVGVRKTKQADAGVAVGAFNAKACGVQLLKQARRVELQRLMRARDDPAFIDVQQRMRQTDAQRPVCAAFLQGLRPVSESDIVDHRAQGGGVHLTPSSRYHRSVYTFTFSIWKCPYRIRTLPLVSVVSPYRYRRYLRPSRT